MVVRKVRTGIKTSSKAQEKTLVLKAKELKKKPNLILPECRGKCRKCWFDKIKKQMRKLQNLNGEKLSYFTRHGDHLIRAYATSLIIANTGKAPYLAVAHLPHNNVAYVVRGKTKKEKLIGVQYYDNPVLRLLSIADIAKKKKLHIYSTKNCFVCTGKESKPPEEFINDIIPVLKMNLKCRDRVYSCGHESNFKLKIKFYNITIVICKSCTSANNTFYTFAQHMLSPKIKKEFNVEAAFHPKCMIKCNECKINVVTPADVLEKYLNGSITDKEFIIESSEKIKKGIRKTEQKIFIRDDACYGSDANAFISSFNPTEAERIAFETILKKIKKPLIVEDATSNKILSMYWDEFGMDMLFALTNDKEISEEMYNEKKQPSQILKEVMMKYKQKGIAASLPKYSKLAPVAEFADRIGRTYKMRDKEASVKEIEKLKTDNTKIKSVAYAFLLTFESSKGKEWQYSLIEKEFAAFLKEYTKKLVEAGPEKYHEALQSLLKATGCTETIRKN